MNKRLPPHVLNSILVLSASIGISACSGQSFPGSQLLGGQQKASYVAPVLKPLEKITSTATASKLWQVNTGTALSHVKIHPYANNIAVYAAAGSGVSAWDKNSGKSLWKQSLGEHITGGVNGGEGFVFAGTNSGKAVALDATTGAIKWISNVETEVLAVSKASLGVVVVRTIDGKLHGLNSKNGEILWQRVQRTPELSLYGASVPLVVSNGVIAGFDNGVVAAYGLKTGQPVWEIKLSTQKSGSEVDKLADIDGRLKSLGTALFTSNGNGRIVGANIGEGTVGWTRAFSSFTGAEANAGGVYSTDDNGNVWKLNPKNGQQMWKQDALENRQPTAPTLTQDGSHIVVADKQGNIHWIATPKGKITSRISGDPAGYNTPPLNSDGVIYTLGRSGVLTATKSQ
ncbi:outer membrane protein assembly factor BamB [Leucothrix arctica]|uniref:outer membrane protein assembly factor BamB n=1 Tax=Leucothrix arctica TaxID=1481894 RepID=UPI001304B62E|nr:outer membrane protein assembly factor BamB [Leucothrix arctica]